jgi:thioredoxin 1
MTSQPPEAHAGATGALRYVRNLGPCSDIIEAESGVRTSSPRKIYLAASLYLEKCAGGIQMKGEEDEELERIKREKLREMMETASGEKQGISSSDKPVAVTDATFKEVVNNHPLVVVDCWAPWCGPCNMVAPVVEELAQNYAGKVLFGKLNVDNNRKVATEYQIMSIPTLLVFKDGRLVDRIVGAMPKQMLEPKLTRYL